MTCRSLRALRFTEPGEKFEGPRQCTTGAFRVTIRDQHIADGYQRDCSSLLKGHMALAAQSKRNMGHSRRSVPAGLRLALTSAAES